MSKGAEMPPKGGRGRGGGNGKGRGGGGKGKGRGNGSGGGGAPPPNVEVEEDVDADLIDDNKIGGGKTMMLLRPPGLAMSVVVLLHLALA